MIQFNVKKLIYYFYISIELIFKIFNLIPGLNLRYLDLSGRIDSNISLGICSKLENPKKIKLSDIKNKKMRISLFLSGIFKKWNIYYIRTNGDNHGVNNYKRDVIFLTKDILTETNMLYRYRVNDNLLNNKYNYSSDYLSNLGYEDNEFYKFEPQVFIICALHTIVHDLKEVERKRKYEIEKNKELEDEVKKRIKNKMLFRSCRMKYINNDYPIFHKVVENDRLDLANDILNSIEDNKRKQEIVTYKVNNSGDYVTPNGKLPIDFVKSDEMKNLINCWTDLELYERYLKIMKIKKR